MDTQKHQQNSTDTQKSENTIGDNTDDVSIEQKNTDDVSELPLGDILSVSDAYSNITAKEKSIFIALAGPSGCGKTTLLTAIYQRFQKSPADDYYFAGSKTLLGFEQRAYLTRLRSRQTIPNTPKTRRGVEQLLHLKIWNSNTDNYLNLLISDFSGEDYSSIKTNTNYAKSDFGIIKSAKCLVIILDGDLISKKDQRNSTLKDAAELLRTFADADLLRSDVNIIVATSKYDIVKKRYEADPSLSAYEEYIKSRFNTIVKPFNKEIIFINVTAVADSATDNYYELSLKEMLKSWVDSSITNYKYLYNEPDSMKSQFNCFCKKQRVVL